MADLMDAQAEIQEVMGQTFATPDGLDEDELLGELDALDAELAAEAATASESGPSYLADDPSELPAAPARPAAVAAGAGGRDGFGLPEAPQKN
jgi:charged multivesicular body protein 5